MCTNLPGFPGAKKCEEADIVTCEPADVMNRCMTIDAVIMTSYSGVATMPFQLKNCSNSFMCDPGNDFNSTYRDQSFYIPQCVTVAPAVLCCYAPMLLRTCTCTCSVTCCVVLCVMYVMCYMLRVMCYVYNFSSARCSVPFTVCNTLNMTGLVTSCSFSCTTPSSNVDAWNLGGLLGLRGIPNTNDRIKGKIANGRTKNPIHPPRQ